MFNMFSVKLSICVYSLIYNMCNEHESRQKKGVPLIILMHHTTTEQSNSTQLNLILSETQNWFITLALLWTFESLKR